MLPINALTYLLTYLYDVHVLRVKDEAQQASAIAETLKREKDSYERQTSTLRDEHRKIVDDLTTVRQSALSCIAAATMLLSERSLIVLDSETELPQTP